MFDISNQGSGEKNIYWNCLKDGVIMGNFIFRVQVSSSPVSDITEQEVIIQEDDKRVWKPIPRQMKARGEFVVLPSCSFGNVFSYTYGRIFEKVGWIR